MTVKRFDRGELQKPTRLANGWVKCDAFIGRSGILQYTNADGTVRREYRSPEEAFKLSSLESFSLVPLTNGHPPGGMLDASNTKEFQVGTVNSPKQDGQRVRAQILITDANAIRLAEGGKQELSMGYCCECVEEPGEFEGVRYDARQVDVQGNHIAMVDAGRAGAEIRLRMDTKDSVVVLSSNTPIHDDSARRNTPVKKIKVDGIEVEVSELAASLIDKATAASNELVTKYSADAKVAQDQLAKQQARADHAEAELKKVKAELAEAPAKALATATARVALENTASKVLEGQKFDGKTDQEIKRAVAEHVLETKLDGKSEAYVEASFELALKQFEEVSPLDAARAGTAPIEHADQEDGEDSEALAEKMRQRSRNAYRTVAAEK